MVFCVKKAVFFLLLFVSCARVPAVDNCDFIEHVLLKERQYDAFSEEVKKLFSVLTIGDYRRPAGTFRYEALPYPSDVDILESATFYGPKEEASVFFANRLSGIAKQIKALDGVFFGDFKAGYDERFHTYLGDSEKNGKYVNYDPVAIRTAINSWYNKGWISKDKEQELLALVKDEPSFWEWTELGEAIRIQYTIRWTLDEIIQQQKKLVGGKIIALQDAIQGTFVKIDIIAKIRPGIFAEMSNFYYLQYVDQGVKGYVSLDEDFIESLFADISYYADKSTEGTRRSSLTAAKRMWSLAVALREFKLLTKLHPLFLDSATALEQVKSEAEVLALLAQNPKTIKCHIWGDVVAQVQGFEKRILAHSQPLSYAQLISILNHAYMAYEKECFLPSGNYNPDANVTITAKKALEESMNALVSLLTPVIEERAAGQLKILGINLENISSNFGEPTQCPLKP